MHVVDRGSHTIRRIDHNNGSVATILGAPTNDARVDGPRANARLTAPFGITTDDSGQNVFIADICFERPPNNTIRKYDTMAAAVSTVSGVPYRVGGLIDPPVDGPKDAAKFGIPIDMVRIGGDLFVLDLFGNAVRKVNIASGETKTIAGELTVPGNSDGVGALAHFKFFDNSGGGGEDEGFGLGIATDGTSIYVSDAANHAIRKVNATTGDTTTIAGGSKGTANGVGKAAQFQNPGGLAIDGGFLYIADTGDGTIRRMDLASTEVTTFMGLSGVNESKDGDATQATFARPARLAADGIGNIFVTETPNFESGGGSSTIRRIDIKRKLASTFAGTKGSAGFMQGPLPGSLNCPSAVHVNAKGDLMFTDFCDGIVGVIQPL